MNNPDRLQGLRIMMPAVPDDCRISPLEAADIVPLTVLVREIWHQHYPGIITVKQIEYMLKQRYSPETIRAEMASGAARWVKLLVNGALGGFASYEADDTLRSVKFDKLYVHGVYRGRGCGAALARHVEHAAVALGCDKVHLRVNRNNFDSIAVYRRLEYKVVEKVKTHIGGGFYMDDYVMAKDVKGKA